MQIEGVDQLKSETSFHSSSVAGRIQLQNILVPTDFSEVSVKALSYGAAFARRFNATLWLLHILEPTPPMMETEGIPVVLDEQQLTSEAERRMAEFAAKHVPPDVAVTSLVRHGSTVREISDFAKDRNIDLVVASTHHHTRLGRALFGGVTERIVHHSPCPILIVREDEHEFLDPSVADGAKAIRLDRILAPVDFSDCSKKALRYAVAFAKQFNAEVFCLHVAEPEKPLILVETEGFRKEHKIEAEKNLAALLQEIDGTVAVKSAIVSGPPHREIVNIADERKVDMIVIGEHSRAGVIGRFILGSTTDEVVKYAHCPILVVRSVEHEFVG